MATDISSLIDTTGLTDGQGMDASDVTTPINDLIGVINDYLNGTRAWDQIRLTPDATLTISSGAVNITQTVHTIDTEGAASSDDLDTIGGDAFNGHILFLRAADTDHTVVIKHATGNIYTYDGTDISLDETYKLIMLLKDDDLWFAMPVAASDASGLSFTPTTLTDWDSNADPGNVDDALDQLAERVDDNEILIGAVAILRDEKATTTDGGGSSATTWNARDLNTEVYDGQSIVAISSNQFTPVAGTYELFATAPGIKVNAHRLRLYNVTGAASVDEGPNAWSANADNVGCLATLNTVFTANGTDAYRIDHYTAAAVATTGLGRAVSDGTNEAYLEIRLRKIG